jgi:hypothetical protein
MQHNWQHIIYNREATPPPGAWDNIAHQLDVPAEEKNWATGIYLQEEVPPAGVWKDIAAALDTDAGSNWQTRLYEKEAAPPEGVWASISAALDADNARVITMQPRTKSKQFYFRMAAAAAVIVAIAGTALWFSGRRSFDNDMQTVAKNNTAEKAKPAAGPTAAATIPPVAAAPQETQTVANTAAKKQVQPAGTKPAANTIAPLEYVKNNEMAFLPDNNPVLSNTKKLPDNNGQVNTDIALMNAPANTYISISGPDGQSIRVSSKFASLVGYLTDGPQKEERLDIIIRESAMWKATFRQWREKMTSNNAAPSFGNFMDIIEMGKLLNDKQ